MPSAVTRMAESPNNQPGQPRQRYNSATVGTCQVEEVGKQLSARSPKPSDDALQLAICFRGLATTGSI